MKKWRVTVFDDRIWRGLGFYPFSQFCGEFYFIFENEADAKAFADLYRESKLDVGVSLLAENFPFN